MGETPEEIARALVEDWHDRNASLMKVYIRDEARDKLVFAIAAAIRDAYDRACRRALRMGDPDVVADDIRKMRDGESGIRGEDAE